MRCLAIITCILLHLSATSGLAQARATARIRTEPPPCQLQDGFMFVAPSEKSFFDMLPGPALYRTGQQVVNALQSWGGGAEDVPSVRAGQRVRLVVSHSCRDGRRMAADWEVWHREESGRERLLLANAGQNIEGTNTLLQGEISATPGCYRVRIKSDLYQASELEQCTVTRAFQFPRARVVRDHRR